MSNQSDTVNNEEMNKGKNLKDWKMPSVPVNQIYKHSIFSKFSIKSDYKIKTFERTFSLDNENESRQLFDYELMDMQWKYSFIHIGLVQVAVKPLIRQGLNTSVSLCLRDARHLNFDDSLLGMIETSLYEDPIYFNCFPNYCLAMSDPNLLKGLELDIKINNNMMTGSQPLTIVYRICYKLMKSKLEPQALDRSPKGYTSLIQTNARKYSVQIPKKIGWNQNTLPKQSILETVEPAPKIEEYVDDDSYISQRSDGKVAISFQRKSDSHISSSSSSRHFEDRQLNKGKTIDN